MSPRHRRDNADPPRRHVAGAYAPQHQNLMTSPSGPRQSAALLGSRASPDYATRALLPFLQGK
jgi:hypothetical protein